MQEGLELKGPGKFSPAKYFILGRKIPGCCGKRALMPLKLLKGRGALVKMREVDAGIKVIFWYLMLI